MDLMLPGPYNEIWTQVFTDHRMSVFHEWRDERLGKGVRSVCFRKAIFNPPGSGSPISKDKGLDSTCRDGALVQGFANFTLSKLDIFPVKPADGKVEQRGPPAAADGTDPHHVHLP